MEQESHSGKLKVTNSNHGGGPDGSSKYSCSYVSGGNDFKTAATSGKVYLTDGDPVKIRNKFAIQNKTYSVTVCILLYYTAFV